MRVISQEGPSLKKKEKRITEKEISEKSKIAQAKKDHPKTKIDPSIKIKEINNRKDPRHTTLKALL